jgi:outer membrane protein assembly factor BamB
MKLRLPWIFAAAGLLVATAALATTTRFFRQTTAKDFEEGEATSSMVLPNGEVIPGMKATRLALDAAFAWCVALSPDGRTAYFGTGDQGRIYTVPVAASAGEAEKLAEIDAPWVTALAARSDATLLAGSTPGGRVFAVDGKTGTARTFAKLPAEHIWALLSDAKNARTYAATGIPGQVFVIDGKGKERLLWDSGDKHVMALAAADKGVLLAGTADRAILYRVHADGQAEALHDFEANEIRAIARVSGATYLAVNAFERPGDAPATPAVGAQPGKGTKIAPGPAPVSGAQPRADQVKGHAAVYRLDDDGRIEQVLALADGYFTALLVGPDNQVYAASGTQGKVYRISPDRTAALAIDLPERQALAMVATPEGFLVGTGDVGAIFRVRPASASDASYLSKVLDADGPARWGFLRWTGSADLVFETRAGNTAKPDKAWSDWAKLESLSHHDQQGQGKVAGTQARYLQYRVGLPAPSSSLREVLAYYVPHNQRARVTEVYLADAAAAPAASGAGGAAGSLATVPAGTRSHSSVLKLRWKVENPDNDELIYRLWFRQERQPVWQPLGGPDPLSKSEYDWNTDSVPDGHYLIRVWVSDEKVTPKDRALDFTFDSPSFLVDNTRPAVLDLQAQLPRVTGRVHDAASVISQIEYSIDGNDWRPVSPDDGILDEMTEAFSIRLPPSLTAGPHIITVRAWDSADNLGSAHLQVQINK